MTPGKGTISLAARTGRTAGTTTGSGNPEADSGEFDDLLPDFRFFMRTSYADNRIRRASPELPRQQLVVIALMACPGRLLETSPLLERISSLTIKMTIVP